MQRLYVLVRADMKPGQQAVQAGHAVAEWCANEACRFHWDGREMQTPEWRWRNHVLVYLTVRNERELREWFDKFSKPHRPGEVCEGAIAWHEPDWQNQMTAFAVIGKREEFEGLDLL